MEAIGHSGRFRRVTIVGLLLLHAPFAAADDRARPAGLQDVGAFTARHRLNGRYEGVELAGGVAGATIRFDIELDVEGQGSFLRAATGKCLAVSLFEEQSPAGSGICVYEDADGDLLYMQFAQDAFTESGNGRSVGGTGKYVGLDVTTEHSTLSSDQEGGGRFWATGVRSGSWKRTGSQP